MAPGRHKSYDAPNLIMVLPNTTPPRNCSLATKSTDSAAATPSSDPMIISCLQYVAVPYTDRLAQDTAP